MRYNKGYFDGDKSALPMAGSVKKRGLWESGEISCGRKVVINGTLSKERQSDVCGDESGQIAARSLSNRSLWNRFRSSVLTGEDSLIRGKLQKQGRTEQIRVKRCGIRTAKPGAYGTRRNGQTGAPPDGRRYNAKGTAGAIPF